jgi:hypothetical protein
VLAALLGGVAVALTGRAPRRAVAQGSDDGCGGSLGQLQDVSVVMGENARAAAETLGARGFSDDITFCADGADRETRSELRVLAHEAKHAVQRAARASRTAERTLSRLERRGNCPTDEAIAELQQQLEQSRAEQANLRARLNDLCPPSCPTNGDERSEANLQASADESCPCPAGERTCEGGTSCCPDVQICCDGTCCPPDVAFCDSANGGCCPPDRTCDGVCCPVGQHCTDGLCNDCDPGEIPCGNACCSAGATCFNGECRTDCTGLRGRATPEKPCCHGLVAGISGCDSSSGWCLYPVGAPLPGTGQCTGGANGGSCECDGGFFRTTCCIDGICSTRSHGVGC